MIPASRQRNYLQSALYVVIAGVLAALLLDRLLTYAEAMEKAAMEATVSQLTTALYARLALNVLRGDALAVEELETQSPFRTAHADSPAYLGEFDGLPPGAEGGKWYFDSATRELVYLPNLKRNLEGAVMSDSRATLRFRTEVRRTATNAYAGIVLRPVAEWRWEPKP